MKFLKKYIYKSALLIVSFSLPFFSASAAGAIKTCDTGKICNPINADTITGAIKTLLEGALRIGIPIIALAIIYCGFLFVEARGNSEKLTKAKGALLYTLIGAAILLGSWAIATLISETVLAL